MQNYITTGGEREEEERIQENVNKITWDVPKAKKKKKTQLITVPLS